MNQLSETTTEVTEPKVTERKVTEIQEQKATEVTEVINEYKSIKFKSMMLSSPINTIRNSATDMGMLDKFLENEKTTNSVEPWNKLDKTVKIRKLTSFAEEYKTKNMLSQEEYSKLIVFLKDCLDRKKLQKVKDVVYDKVNGEVKDIPALHHNKTVNHFTLKNNDKHVSTTRSLAPKKVRGTVKNVENYDSDTSN